MINCVIVGTGGMASAHAQAFQNIRGCKIVAGVDIDLQKAKAFCEEHGIPKAYDSVESLLKHEDFDAASVVTPDAFHQSCVLPLLKAKKHVLCEKPLAPVATDAKDMWQKAKKSGVIHMVNFSYRNSSALQKVQQVVASGKLGRIHHFEAHYLQSWLTSNAWGDWKTTPAWLWRLSTEHGSKGSLGDIGVHIVDLASFACNENITEVFGQLECFSKAPNEQIGDYKLDANDSSFMTVKLSGGGMGTITTTRWATGQCNSLAIRIHGEKGGIRLDLDQSYDEYEICTGKDIHTSTWKTKKAKSSPTIYQRFIKSIKSGINDPSDFQRGYEIQKVLDATITSNEQKTIVQL